MADETEKWHIFLASKKSQNACVWFVSTFGKWGCYAITSDAF